MRILIVNTVAWKRNGITNVIWQYYQHLVGDGFEFDFVGINEPSEDMKKEIETHNGRCYVLPHRLKNPIGYLIDLARICKRGGYDAIHAHGNSSTLALEMLGALLGGVRIRIAHSHSTKCKYKMVNKVLKPLFLLSCTHRIACGIEAGKWLYGYRDFSVVNNCIQTERYMFDRISRDGIRNAYCVKENEVAIGHVGMMDKNKNQIFLVEILNLLVASDKQYHLFLIGKGEERENILQRVQRYGLSEKVHFVGEVKNVEDYLSACDLVAMPSFYEGLPLSLIEAQASGLVSIVSDTITREVDKTESCVFLSLKAGTREWADKISDIDIKKDREVVSQRARELIQIAGYDVKAEARKLGEYYVQSGGR